MSRIGFSERVRIVGVRVQGLRRRAASRLFGSPLMRWRYGLGNDQGLVMVPQSLRTADPSFWSEFESGQFGLSGSVARLDEGCSPFEIERPGEAWLRALHGFGWLRHLEAAGDSGAETAARDEVMTWLKSCRQATGAPGLPAVRARRIISWITHASFFLEGASEAEFDRFGRGLSREVLILSSTWRNAAEGYDRLLCLTALMLAHMSQKGQERQRRAAQGRLDAEIGRQILSDGGHISRNPSVLIELLLDWLPLKSCFDARHEQPPEMLSSAIERMLAMLRFLRLGNGGVARFNGMGVGDPAGLATLLAYDDRATPGSGISPASRYARLQNGTTVVIADAGPPPPLMLSGEAHAGCLSFEASSANALLFVNCGAPGPADTAWRAVARATASHTTVSLGELSSARLVRHAGLEAILGGVPLSLPATVGARLETDAGGVRFDACHDGYLLRLGLLHRRELCLTDGGLVLSGTEWLETKGGHDRLKRDVPFTVHFHLHPDATAEPCPAPGLLPSECPILINLRNGQRWLFQASGAPLSLEESTFFAGSFGPRPSLQIVLRGATGGTSVVRWSVRLTDSPQPSPADGAQTRGP